MEALRIKIAKDYSSTPGPRAKIEGDYSGEVFRDTILAPAVKSAIDSGERLLIDLDGTAGYGTSFLEESFGGLIRHDRFTLTDLKNHLEFISLEEPYLVDDIFEYMNDAQKELDK